MKSTTWEGKPLVALMCWQDAEKSSFLNVTLTFPFSPYLVCTPGKSGHITPGTCLKSLQGVRALSEPT